MSIDLLPALRAARPAWNRGRIIGQKRPLLPQHVWSIRVRFEMAGNARDLALFDMALDSKLRGCDLVCLRVRNLEKIRVKNGLRKPGHLTMDGVPIGVSKINIPFHALATKEDRIAPWHSIYPTTGPLRCKTNLVLDGSGHIAGGDQSTRKATETWISDRWRSSEKPRRLAGLSREARRILVAAMGRMDRRAEARQEAAPRRACTGQLYPGQFRARPKRHDCRERRVKNASSPREGVSR